MAKPDPYLPDLLPRTLDVYRRLNLDPPHTWAVHRMRANLSERRVEELTPEAALAMVNRNTGRTTFAVCQAIACALVYKQAVLTVDPVPGRAQAVKAQLLEGLARLRELGVASFVIVHRDGSPLRPIPEGPYIHVREWDPVVEPQRC